MQTETTRYHYTHLLEWLKLKIKNCKQTKFIAIRNEWTKNYDIFIPGNYSNKNKLTNEMKSIVTESIDLFYLEVFRIATIHQRQNRIAALQMVSPTPLAQPWSASSFSLI